MKRRAPTKIASEEAARKFREYYIQFITGGFSNESIKSVIPDSGASLSTGKNAEDYEATSEKSPKEFRSTSGEVEKATDIVEYPYKVREEAKRVDIVPNVKNDLMSIGKYADAGYISFFDDKEVNIYDMNNTTITVSRGSVL